MVKNKNLECVTGIIHCKNDDNTLVVVSRGGGQKDCYNISPLQTQFMGATRDSDGYSSLFAGLSVNIWVDQDNKDDFVAKWVSPNYR